jgi:hypothetical protein
MKNSGEFARTPDIFGPERTILAKSVVDQIKPLQQSKTPDISEKARLLLEANNEHQKTIAAYSALLKDHNKVEADLKKEMGNQPVDGWMKMKLWMVAPVAMYAYQGFREQQNQARDTIQTAYEKVLSAEKALGECLRDNKQSLTDDEEQVLKAFDEQDNPYLFASGYRDQRHGDQDEDEDEDQDNTPKPKLW